MQIVDLVSVDKEREMVVWHLADVRANRPGARKTVHLTVQGAQLCKGLVC